MNDARPRVREVPLNQQRPMFPLSAAELADLKDELRGKVNEYIRIEDEKKAADADFNERLTKLWDEIRGLSARIREGE